MRVGRICGFLVFFLWAAACGAEEPILVIRHGASSVEIPLAKIEALPQVEYVAILPGMDDAPHRVRGPLLQDVLALAGFSGETLLATAYDRYHAEIPISDLDDYALLAAREVDGKALTLRDKGPLWIVYPSEAHPNLRFNPIYEARSVWQLKEISVR
ncbi:hypothetical protein M2360_002715 [Rhizobium sp. SG_E_25_P2]|uniref:hypothetical protein n=1 Tax=Rhizobium sp. SG_E_25_P2 TaxID=2879942 RepID=UPI002475B168|nr:hypothetical protein [Rhizobium sp. SG_E_25_P2]MDH6267318.1 hypothetical protein [Rhizobium sp. SG_E_25_P2]